MKILRFVILIAIIILASLHYVKAATPGAIIPSLELDKKIAYQQGQFGALYDHCGTPDQKAVIGNSLSVWKSETFRGYNSTPSDRAAVEQAFDTAANDVVADQTSCKDWIKQAAATWSSIVVLSEHGLPVASR